MSHIIYCFNNGGSPGWLQAVALREDGVFMSAHVCSHECFMQHDLGVIGTWHHEVYRAKCPDGFVLEWVPNPGSHAGLQRAIEFSKNQPAVPEDEKPGITFEMSDGSKIKIP